ncbi:MAG: transcription-repair coupling factor [Bacillota bacterium]
MKGIIEPLKELESYQNMLQALLSKTTPILATGLMEVEKTHVAYALKEHTKKPLVLLTYSEARGKSLQEDLQFFCKGHTHYYPAKDVLFYSADVHSKEMNRQRFQLLDHILKNEGSITIFSMEALLERYVPKEVFHSFIIKLEVGGTIDIEKLTMDCITMGYERVEQVESVGQFSIRGGIIDIFSITAEEAIRIELFDDEIDSIRVMDSETQRSIAKVDTAEIFPMRELVYHATQCEAVGKAILKDVEKAIVNMRKNVDTEAIERIEYYAKEDANRLIDDHNIQNIGNYITYFYDNTVSILDYFPENTLLILDDPERIHEHMELVIEEYTQSVQSRLLQGYLVKKQTEFLFPYADILQKIEGFDHVLFSGLSQRTPSFSPVVKVEFTMKTSLTFSNQMELFVDELILMKKRKYRIVILGGSGTKSKRLIEALRAYEIEAVYQEQLENMPERGVVNVIKGSLSKGFQYDMIQFVIFSADQIFSQKNSAKKPKKKKKANALESFTDLSVGDYVVHDAHGIGQYGGLEKITIDNIQKDYIKISYRDGGNLFISVNQMDMIQKYIGNGANPPRLSKLGGQDWEKAKSKTRATLKILAEDLVALYAKRKMTKGHSFLPDTVWQREFEEAFPYEETDDQENAILDVKNDMESDKVMDRLICGDVGYGKTEVAIRAAFKAVQDGKQVAFLVPTTILAQQHYRTFVQRMAEYPISVELLSRFRTAKEQKHSLKNMKDGFGDIIIGTHRLLSKDVEFKNLGLMIVDEEQRFGVSHKEKMKRLQTDVDILTLSATPIPRTLHMSLSGIRDMSILEEPPQERHPVQTYVMENNSEFVKEAINRELGRGGQVYYLHNRVDTIAGEASKLQKLIPEANITFAHGQMPERQLESIMEQFLLGEVDVLVCTTIIETGMDIANANTIIIQDADRMGLSQLYQLRGRVGRSNRIAYAYLFYQRDKMLREVAEKRLQTIREFTEFGAGFKIALRDLEIRGAGNLLGAEQHGHMATIGYDMYCRLLEEEVLNLQGLAPKEKRIDTTIDLNVSAFLPDTYIKNQQQRMEIYKKIALIRNEEDYFQMQEEIEDRYGDLPTRVQTLLDIALIKGLATTLGMTAIAERGGIISFAFDKTPKVDPVKLTEIITNNPKKYVFIQGELCKLTLRLEKNKPNPIKEIKILLNAINT